MEIKQTIVSNDGKHEQVPVAGNSAAGIASFDTKDFIVDNDGHVTSKIKNVLFYNNVLPRPISSQIWCYTYTGVNPDLNIKQLFMSRLPIVGDIFVALSVDTNDSYLGLYRITSFTEYAGDAQTSVYCNWEKVAEAKTTGKQGPIGPIGPAGPVGPKGDTGYMKVNPKGSYIFGNSYYAWDSVVITQDTLDGIEDNPTELAKAQAVFGNSYICIVDGSDVTTVAPWDSNTAWQLSGLVGAVGPQGPEGPTGPTGPKGNTGNPALTYSNIVQNVSSDNIITVDGNTEFNRIVTSDDVNSYVFLLVKTSTNTYAGLAQILSVNGDDTVLELLPNTYLSIVGPKGDKGDEGDVGYTAFETSQIYVATHAPVLNEPYQFSLGDDVLYNRIPELGDTFIAPYKYTVENSTVIRSYICTFIVSVVANTEFTAYMTAYVETTGIQGPQGLQGPAGERGPQGAPGGTGPQGPKGDPGTSFKIAENVASQSDLPAASSDLQGIAYSVGTVAPYDIYVCEIDNGSYTWINHGPLQGPKGDTGEQGPQGPAGEQGETGPAGATGAQGEVGPEGPAGAQGLKGSSGAIHAVAQMDTYAGPGECDWSLVRWKCEDLASFVGKQIIVLAHTVADTLTYPASAIYQGVLTVINSDGTFHTRGTIKEASFAGTNGAIHAVAEIDTNPNLSPQKIYTTSITYGNDLTSSNYGGKDILILVTNTVSRPGLSCKPGDVFKFSSVQITGSGDTKQYSCDVGNAIKLTSLVGPTGPEGADGKPGAIHVIAKVVAGALSVDYTVASSYTPDPSGRAHIILISSGGTFQGSTLKAGSMYSTNISGSVVIGGPVTVLGGMTEVGSLKGTDGLAEGIVGLTVETDNDGTLTASFDNTVTPNPWIGDNTDDDLYVNKFAIHKSLKGELQIIKLTSTYGYQEFTFNVISGRRCVDFNKSGVTENATNGTLSEADLNTLRSSRDNYIEFNDEVYYLNDNGHESGYLVYTHTGQDTVKHYFIKCINIAVSTRAWSLNTLEVSPDVSIWTGNLQTSMNSGATLQSLTVNSLKAIGPSTEPKVNDLVIITSSAIDASGRGVYIGKILKISNLTHPAGAGYVYCSYLSHSFARHDITITGGATPIVSTDAIHISIITTRTSIYNTIDELRNDINKFYGSYSIPATGTIQISSTRYLVLCVYYTATTIGINAVTFNGSLYTAGVASAFTVANIYDKVTILN